MHTAVETLHVITLVFGAFALGGAVYEGLVVLPLVRARGAEGIAMLKALRLSPHNPSYRYLPASGLLSGLPALAAVVLWSHQPESSAVLTAVGFALYIGAFVMNLLYWGLAERRFYEAAETPPGIIEQLSVRNTGRAVFYLLGFVLFAVAAVLD